jgi:hypothetical protein
MSNRHLVEPRRQKGLDSDIQKGEKPYARQEGSGKPKDLCF